MIKSQFTYCQLIWMFYSKTNMQWVEKVPYKTLRVVYNNYMATYDELIALDNNLKIHRRHLQFLAIEMYKSKKNLTKVSYGKHITRKYPIFTEMGYFPLYSKRKHSEIWNKLIQFQRNCFVEQPTNRVKIM